MNCHYLLQFSSVQLLSRVRLFATPWIAVLQASLSITNSQSSPRLMFIESVMPSSHLILCRPLLLLPPIPPSIRVLAWILKLQTKNYWQCQNAKKKKKKNWSWSCCDMTSFRHFTRKNYMLWLCYKVYKDSQLAPTLVAIVVHYRILPTYFEDEKKEHW